MVKEKWAVDSSRIDRGEWGKRVQTKKSRISGLSCHSGVAVPLRILFCLLTVWTVSC